MNNSSLFVRLLYLYRKVSVVVIRIRMRSYHKFIESNDNFNITSLLNKQINVLAANSIKNISPNIILPQSDIIKKTQFTELTLPKVDNKTEIISGIESEFAKYLKQKKSFSIDHPYMGDKLTKSAWDHIHCTIRHARQGHIDMAKLHADIAGHALEEAAHYMEEQEYSKLVFEIEECFINSKNEKEQEV